jgi:DNA-binding MarR family transcriptional regulator
LSNQNISRKLWKQIFFTAENLRKTCIPKNDDSFVKLTLRQLHFIRTIHLESEGQEKGVSLKKLAKTLEITAAAASEMVETLVQKQVIIREHNDDDRRGIIISLTPELNNKFYTGETGLDAITAEFLDSLPVDQQKEFLTLVEEFNNFLEDKITGDKND